MLLIAASRRSFQPGVRTVENDAHLAFRIAGNTTIGKIIKRGTFAQKPQPLRMHEDNFELQRELNVEAFKLLYDIEIILRELCAKKLEASHGKHWAKRGLPPDVLPKVKDALSYEQKTKWHRAILHHPLYYIDFPDLKKIVIGGTNWNSIFSEIFSYRAGTEVALSELELLRNQVAHNRFVSREDLHILRGIHSKLLNSVSQADIDACRSAANNRISIISRLNDFSLAIIRSLSAMKNAIALPSEETPDSSLLDEWWFDSAYLGYDVEPLKAFSTLCARYSGIPSGVGQAFHRRKWIAEHNAVASGEAADATMRSIQEKASQTYE